MVCTTCKAVLVTARRNRCTSCTSSCRTSCSSAKSSCTETSPDPVVSPGYYRWCPPLSRICRPSPRHASPSYRRKSRGFTWFYIPIRIRPSTSIPGSSYSLPDPLSLPIVTRSSTTDLQAHPVTSLTHACLREVSDNMASTEPARASSSHLLQSDST